MQDKTLTTLQDGNIPYSVILQDLIIKRARLEGAISVVQEFIAKAKKESVCIVEVNPDVMEMLNEQA
jgi:hypothetical protein